MRIVKGFFAATLFSLCFCLGVDRAAGSPLYLAEEVQYRMIGVSGCPDPVVNLLGVGVVLGTSTFFMLPELGVIVGGTAIKTQTATSSSIVAAFAYGAYLRLTAALMLPNRFVMPIRMEASYVTILGDNASWSILEAGIDLGWSIYFEGLSLVVNVGRLGARPAGSTPSLFFAWYPGLGISIPL